MGARIVGAAGEPSDFVFSTATYVTPGYFETLRLPLLRGRTLRDSDTRTSAQAVVVNQAFATRYFKDRDADRRARAAWAAQVREIVGVVGQRAAARRLPGFRPDRRAAGHLHAVLAVSRRRPAHHSRLVLDGLDHSRRPADGAVTEPAIRRAMAEVDPQLAVSADSRRRRRPQRGAVAPAHA